VHELNIRQTRLEGKDEARYTSRHGGLPGGEQRTYNLLESKNGRQDDVYIEDDATSICLILMKEG
jgi:hypothetical protein